MASTDDEIESVAGSLDVSVELVTLSESDNEEAVSLPRAQVLDLHLYLTHTQLGLADLAHTQLNSYLSLTCTAQAQLGSYLTRT